MKIKYIDCKLDIPELQETPDISPNGWISPTGDFYGIGGAYHEKAAAWISIFELGADDKTLKKGTFFDQSWQDWLLKQGWCSIKNLSWLGGENPSTFRYHRELTERQKTALFDYAEQFDCEWKELINDG